MMIASRALDEPRGFAGRARAASGVTTRTVCVCVPRNAKSKRSTSAEEAFDDGHLVAARDFGESALQGSAFEGSGTVT